MVAEQPRSQACSNRVTLISSDAPVPLFESILHPSDFSEASELAFAHALRLALAGRAKLELLHSHPGLRDSRWQDFPAVRKTLERWGQLPEGSPRSALRDFLGIQVDKVVSTHNTSPTEAILGYLLRGGVDLIVLGTQGRDGLPRWLHRSTAEPVARRSETSTLLVPQGARGFVSAQDGAVSLERILIPVDSEPAADAALASAASLGQLLDTPVRATLLHVGEASSVPTLEPPRDDFVTWEFETRPGPVVDTILATATENAADLIVMPTAGHEGFLDALRGSTTERVLRRAPCAVLAVPSRVSLNPA